MKLACIKAMLIQNAPRIPLSPEAIVLSALVEPGSIYRRAFLQERPR
jgi:hypothetical protein